MNQVLQQEKFDWLILGQLIFSALAGMILMGSSLVGAVVLSLGDSFGVVPVTETQLGSSLLFSAGLGFAGILMVPSMVHSSLRLFGKSTQRKTAWPGSGWLIFTLPILIYLGYLSQGGSAWGRFTLPLIHVLTNGAGVFWILNLVSRKLPGESPLRFWGVFGSGLTFAPLIALIVEMTILVGIGVVWMIILQSQPELKQEYLSLINRLQQSSVTPVIFQRIASNLLKKPGVSATIFIYIGVIVPLVEELIKPAAIWLLLDRNLSPREGLLLGATAGAGYALFENLTIAADAEIWVVLIISRLGTAAIHILTTGLVGWGIASAVTEKRYLRFGWSLFTAVTLHGVWNGLNILTVLAEFSRDQYSPLPLGSYFTGYAPVGLVILAAGAFLGLIRTNSIFQRAIMAGINQDK